MKKFLLITLILGFPLSVQALTYDSLDVLKAPAYRVGLSEDPEKE